MGDGGVPEKPLSPWGVGRGGWDDAEDGGVGRGGVGGEVGVALCGGEVRGDVDNSVEDRLLGGVGEDERDVAGVWWSRGVGGLYRYRGTWHDGWSHAVACDLYFDVEISGEGFLY